MIQNHQSPFPEYPQFGNTYVGTTLEFDFLSKEVKKRYVTIITTPNVICASKKEPFDI